MISTNLAPLWRTPRPPQRSYNVVDVKVHTPAAPPPPPATVEPATRATPAEPRRLTLEEARALSIDSINLLIKQDPKLVADMVIAAGARRRGELPMAASEVRPAARAILLSGEARRGRQLNDEERQFMSAYLDEIGAS